MLTPLGPSSFQRFRLSWGGRSGQLWRWPSLSGSTSQFSSHKTKVQTTPADIILAHPLADVTCLFYTGAGCPRGGRSGPRWRWPCSSAFTTDASLPQKFIFCCLLTSSSRIGNVIRFSQVLAVLGRQKRAAVAVAVFERMEWRGVRANEYVYSAMIGCYANVREYKDALRTFGKMVAAGVEPNVVTWRWGAALVRLLMLTSSNTMALTDRKQKATFLNVRRVGLWDLIGGEGDADSKTGRSEMSRLMCWPV